MYLGAAPTAVPSAISATISHGARCVLSGRTKMWCALSLYSKCTQGKIPKGEWTGDNVH